MFSLKRKVILLWAILCWVIHIRHRLFWVELVFPEVSRELGFPVLGSELGYFILGASGLMCSRLV
jgi:hypothetical protein